MRLTLVKHAAGFGELSKLRGIIYYKLSPFEQKAFAGTITKGVPNTIRRFSENVWRIVPSTVISYMIYAYYEDLNEKMTRKNPADYECDV